MGTIQQGLKGQGSPKQKAVERRGEAVVFKRLLTGRQHMPKFPSISFCLLNLKHFIPFERGILIKAEGLVKKEDNTRHWGTQY